ncbi:MAG: biopolymer transporter ExbD [Candidatus Hydrogenedentes bacterium]|nr:biopolymer transporter ExbD [Candidatus Hydrogenedentota bacterium]
MRFGQNVPEQPDAIQLAPLIDIVFLILIFFMVTSVYGALESEVDITLPTADSAVQSERNRGEIFINLRADGAIVVNNQEQTIPELQELLHQVAELFPGGAVIIRGDQSAVLGRAIEVLDCCRKADIQNVSFAAIETPGPPSSAGAPDGAG